MDANEMKRVRELAREYLDAEVSPASPEIDRCLIEIVDTSLSVVTNALFTKAGDNMRRTRVRGTLTELQLLLRRYAELDSQARARAEAARKEAEENRRASLSRAQKQVESRREGDRIRAAMRLARGEPDPPARKLARKAPKNGTK